MPFSGEIYHIDLNRLTSLLLKLCRVILHATMLNTLKGLFSEMDYRCLLKIGLYFIIILFVRSHHSIIEANVSTVEVRAPHYAWKRERVELRDIWSQLKVQTIRQLAIAVISTPLCSTPKNQSRKIF